MCRAIPLLFLMLLMSAVAWGDSKESPCPTYEMILRIGSEGLIVVGRVEEVDDSQAHLRIDQVIKGATAKKELTVWGHWKNPRSGSLVLKAKDRAVLFIEPSLDGFEGVFPPGTWLAVALPGGEILPEGEAGRATLKSIRQLMTILDSSIERRNLQILEAATGADLYLRRQALKYLCDGQLNAVEGPERYRPKLFELLEDQSDEVQIAALCALRQMPVDGHLDKLIKIAKSDRPNVAVEAIRVLTRYDTPGSVQCLLDLLGSGQDAIVYAAMEGLGVSKRTQAKQALAQLLTTQKPGLHWYACVCLEGWLQRGDANEVVPAITKLLGDDDEQVRLRAALALRHRSTVPVVQALQVALANEDSEEVQNALLRSLYVASLRGDQATKARVIADLDVVVSLIHRRVDLTSDIDYFIIATSEESRAEAYWKKLESDGNEKVRLTIKHAFELRRLMNQQ